MFHLWKNECIGDDTDGDNVVNANEWKVHGNINKQK